MIYLAAYFLLYLGVAVWVIVDSRDRRYPGLPWAGAILFLGPLVAPIYLSKRNLKARETRTGGLPWNLAKYFALFWTATIAAVFVADLIDFATSKPTYPPSDSDRAIAGIALFTAAVIYFIIWLIPTAVALTTGYLLRKASVVETGSINAPEKVGSSVPSSVVNAPRLVTQVPQSSPPIAIYLTRDGQQSGPYSVEQIRDALREGSVKADDLAWYEGMPDWIPLNAFVTVSEG